MRAEAISPKMEILVRKSRFEKSLKERKERERWAEGEREKDKQEGIEGRKESWFRNPPMKLPLPPE